MTILQAKLGPPFHPTSSISFTATGDSPIDPTTGAVRWALPPDQRAVVMNVKLNTSRIPEEMAPSSRLRCTSVDVGFSWSNRVWSNCRARMRAMLFDFYASLECPLTHFLFFPHGRIYSTAYRDICGFVVVLVPAFLPPVRCCFFFFACPSPVSLN
ncbi:hypothetical protein RSAG8_08555, partial [Rhizoctonia solani AG-8 WAC10335]